MAGRPLLPLLGSRPGRGGRVRVIHAMLEQEAIGGESGELEATAAAAALPVVGAP